MAPAPCSMIALAVKEALWPPTQTKVSGEPRLGRLGEIDDLGHVRQVIARKRDDVGPPALQQTEIRPMVLDLQIDEPDLVPGPAQRLRDELEPERLEPQKHLCVHQGSGVDAEQPHGRPSWQFSPSEPELAERSEVPPPIKNRVSLRAKTLTLRDAA